MRKKLRAAPCQVAPWQTHNGLAQPPCDPARCREQVILGIRGKPLAADSRYRKDSRASHTFHGNRPILDRTQEVGGSIPPCSTIVVTTRPSSQPVPGVCVFWGPVGVARARRSRLDDSRDGLRGGGRLDPRDDSEQRVDHLWVRSEEPQARHDADARGAQRDDRVRRSGPPRCPRVISADDDGASPAVRPGVSHAGMAGAHLPAGPAAHTEMRARSVRLGTPKAAGRHRSETAERFGTSPFQG